MTLAAALLAGTAFAATTAVATRPDPQLGAAIYWFGGYPAPRIPMVGDADADGLGDFVGLYPPEGGILDFIGTSPLGKPFDNVQARRPFAGDARAVACARFSGAGAQAWCGPFLQHRCLASGPSRGRNTAGGWRIR